MAFEFLSQISTVTGFLLVIIFILFIISIKKVLGIIKNALIIIAASVLFPLVGGRLLGLPITPDGETIFSFITLGLFAYFIYLLGATIYKGLSLAEKATKGHTPHMPHMSGGKTKNNERSKHFEYHEAAPVRAIPIKNNNNSKKNWEKDYVEIEDRKQEEGRKQDQGKKNAGKVKMEKIPVIGEDLEEEK